MYIGSTKCTPITFESPAPPALPPTTANKYILYGQSLVYLGFLKPCFDTSYFLLEF
jgi:hypothetical protein